jgi:hypothetical protein
VDLPVIALPETVGFRELELEIERYIARRRRELFALDQQLHRTLVDGAIAGLGLSELVALASKQAETQVVIDRDGDVVAGRPDEPAPAEMLVRARVAVNRWDAPPAVVDGSPAALAAPIATGREFHGLSILLAPPMGIDDDHDVILVSLASAAAIVLGREPEHAAATLTSMLDALAVDRDAGEHSWLAVAVSDGAGGRRRLQRAVRAELAARGAHGHVAVEGEALVVLLPDADTVLAGSLAGALRSRTGSSTLRAGTGRTYAGSPGARRSAEQALTALGHAAPGETAEYGSIEIETLLQRDPGWHDFAVSQLGALLGPRPDERDLLRSLRAYLACGRNAKAAARALTVHRNTLQYRLRRIESILGVQLDDPEDVFALDLACRIVVDQEKRR